jgi:polyphosphate kinase
MSDQPARGAGSRPSDSRAPDARGGGHALIRNALERASPGRIRLPDGSLLNMELSNLAFQERVLELAADDSFPLLERVRFVSIFGSNLDEFFMTRVAGFQRQLGRENEKRTLDGIRPDEQLALIRTRVRALLDLVYLEVLPTLWSLLNEHGIEIIERTALSETDRRALRWQYGGNLEALLTPMIVSAGDRVPHVRNLRPALAVQISGAAAECLGIIALPGDAPHLVPLEGGRRFIPLEEVLRANLAGLFPGRDVGDAHLFRVTRSGNLSLQATDDASIVDLVEESIAMRPFEPVTRLEVAAGTPGWMEDRLLGDFIADARDHTSRLEKEDAYRIPGLIDLKRLEAVASLPISGLRFGQTRRRTPIPPRTSIFDRIAERPVLVRFPRHGFQGTVGRFIAEAAGDPDVEEIRITLYRTNRSSPIVRVLQRAHLAGKRVVAVVEVKASFDERRNIEWGRSLEAAGIRVLYGSESLKVHAKMAVVRRREPAGLATYSYIGTGNLNAATAATYTDLGILTADPDIGAEILDVFDALADLPAVGVYPNLLVAPFNLRDRFMELIRRETEHAAAGREAGITCKLNGVADKQIIGALYEASGAGVPIDLVVRGICSLRPGVDGLSERIRVVGNAGRHLEHSRIFRFTTRAIRSTSSAPRTGAGGISAGVWKWSHPSSSRPTARYSTASSPIVSATRPRGTFSRTEATGADRAGSPAGDQRSRCEYTLSKPASPSAMQPASSAPVPPHSRNSAGVASTYSATLPSLPVTTRMYPGTDDANRTPSSKPTPVSLLADPETRVNLGSDS